MAPGVAVLLDGAGLPAGRDTGCVARRRLVRADARRAARRDACDTGLPLPEVAGRGIEQVSQLHAGTCDLGHPRHAVRNGDPHLRSTRRPGVPGPLRLDLAAQPRDGEPRVITDARIGRRSRPAAPGTAGNSQRNLRG